jgi:hypothetical protein
MRYYVDTDVHNKELPNSRAMIIRSYRVLHFVKDVRALFRSATQTTFMRLNTAD